MALTLSSRDALKLSAYYSSLEVNIHSRSTKSLRAEVKRPEEPLNPNTGEPVRERDWMDVGCGIEGEDDGDGEWG